MPKENVKSKLDETALNYAGIRSFFSGNASIQDRCITALRICDIFSIGWCSGNERYLTFDPTEMAISLKEESNTNNSEDNIYRSTFFPSDNATFEIQSMTVILFTVCFGTNPYMGRRFYAEPILTLEVLSELFAHPNRQFIYAPNGTNHPDPQYQARTIALWSNESLLEERKQLEDFFIHNIPININLFKRSLWNTLSSIAFGNSPISTIKFNNGDCYALSAGKKLIDPVTHRLLGEALILESQELKGNLGLKNLSDKSWTLTTNSGKIHEISCGEEEKSTFPLKPGMRCSISDLNFEVI